MVAAARKRELGQREPRVRAASLRDLRSHKLLPIDCRLYRYFNNIGVRSFILTGAPNNQGLIRNILFAHSAQQSDRAAM